MTTPPSWRFPATSDSSSFVAVAFAACAWPAHWPAAFRAAVLTRIGSRLARPLRPPSAVTNGRWAHSTRALFPQYFVTRHRRITLTKRLNSRRFARRRVQQCATEGCQTRASVQRGPAWSRPSLQSRAPCGSRRQDISRVLGRGIDLIRSPTTRRAGLRVDAIGSRAIAQRRRERMAASTVPSRSLTLS
jgi:hypothetical protein